MNRNKNKFMLLSFLVALAMLGGCRKYIDQQPISEIGVGEAFSSVDNTFKSLMGVYDELQGDNGYGIRISLYYPFDSDEGIVSGGLDNGRRGIGRYDLQLSNSELRNPFNQLYLGVEKANLAIDQIPKSEAYINGSEQEKREMRRMLGEALTLRAQFYHELIRNWGDVPAPMIPSYQKTDLYAERANRDSTYDKLIDDLATAVELLPWRTEVARDERITKGAAKALRARIALYRGGYSLRGRAPSLGTMERPADYREYYEIARQETADLIARRDQHTLNPNFENVWRNVTSFQPDPFGEILFEVGAGGGNSNSDSRQGNYNGVVTNTSSRYGPGGGGVFMLPIYFYAFDSIDTRLPVTIGTYQVNANNNKQPRVLTQLTDGKYRRDWRVPLLPSGLNVGYNWVLIRFSDVLLMFAEAENELNGPTPAAIAAFEEVRKRAYRGNADKIGTTPTSKDEFFTAIMNERYLEFGGEGIRKYDLIRWNKLAEKMRPQTGEVRVKLRQLADATGPYANVPRYLFWRNVGEEIEYLNSRYEPNTFTTAPTGWTRLNWREDISRTNNTYNVGATSVHYIDAIGYFFTDGKSQLFPFDQQTMASYQGRLVQNPGYQ
ncbi:MAG TPA: RagB/SusD family nutrient uptake outer membrane protein [Flavisolibacter sp.]|jgi:hypothetical protein|nr:RagB/SusD family nutrient uptake outer membrane protein [Flavisolibacter sp.]